MSGVRNDHRLENLRLLCPNCHALTPTWRGRKKKEPKIPKAAEARAVRSPRDRAVHTRYVKRHREEWVAANGPCAKCGSSEGLVTAYRDPASANRMASTIWAQSAAVRGVELAKCHVICGQAIWPIRLLSAAVADLSTEHSPCTGSTDAGATNAEHGTLLGVEKNEPLW